MAELTNDKQFRFQPQIQEVVNEVLPMLSKKDREFFLSELEPMLAHRDWQVEDAISRALQCCGNSAVTPGTILTSDAFTRTATGTLGVSDATLGGTSKPWATLAGVWETAAGKAQHPTAIGPTTFDTAVVDTAVVNVETKCVVTATGSTVAAAGVTARQTDGLNYYTFYLYRSGGAVYQLYLSKLIAGGETVLAGPVTPAGLIPGNVLSLKLTCTGSSLTGTTGTDTLTATDTALATGTFQGLFSIKAGVCDWDSFVVTAT